MKRIELPAPEDQIRALRVGDEVALFGRVVTARDAAHKLMVEKRPDFIRPFLQDGAIYHCGPVMKQEKDGRFRAVAAGPTTSIREEPYEAQVMQEYRVRLIIGKGGMGPRTLEACQKVGAVYLHAVGGAAVLLADCIREVEQVFMLDELGVPEAFWVCRVEDFRGVVTMDAAGGSLHQTVLDASRKKRDELIAAS